jgi:hypothetical protein
VLRPHAAPRWPPVHLQNITRHCRWCLQAKNTFPKDIAAKVRADESLVPKGDKKAMQRVMPFLQWVVNEVRHIKS